MRQLLEGRPIATAITYTAIGVLPLYLVSAQAVRLLSELDFGQTELGLVIASFYVTSSIASRWLGPFIDRVGITSGLRIGAGLSALSSLLVLVVGRWYLLPIGLLIGGFSNGVSQLSGNLAVAVEVSGARQGVAFGLKQSAVPTGSLITGLAVPLALEVSWRVPFAVAAVVAAISIALVPRFTSELPPAPTPRAKVGGALIGLTLAVGVAAGLGNSMASFIVDAASDAGFSASDAPRLLALGSVTAIAVRIGVGWLSDRRQRRGVAELVVTLASSSVGFALLTISGDGRTLFALGVVVAFAGIWGWPGLMAYVVTRSSDLPPATSTGMALSAAYLGTVLWPPAFGFVAEQVSYSATFAIGGFMALVSAAIVATSQRYVPAELR